MTRDLSPAATNLKVARGRGDAVAIERSEVALAFEISLGGLSRPAMVSTAATYGAGVGAHLAKILARTSPPTTVSKDQTLPTNDKQRLTLAMPAVDNRRTDGADVVALITKVGLRGFAPPLTDLPKPQHAAATKQAESSDDDGEDVVALARQVGLQRIKPADGGASS